MEPSILHQKYISPKCHMRAWQLLESLCMNWAIFSMPNLTRATMVNMKHTMGIRTRRSTKIQDSHFNYVSSEHSGPQAERMILQNETGYCDLHFYFWGVWITIEFRATDN